MTTIAPSQVMCKEILVASDLSEVSENALGYAKSIAKRFGSHILLVHTSPAVNAIPIPQGGWVQDRSEAHVEEQLEAAGIALRAEGFLADAVNAHGSVKNEIEFLANSHHADLIVLGTHGRRGLNRLIFGSEAEAVTRSAACPVLTVGPSASPAPPGAWIPKNILCAISLDPRGVEAATYGFTLSDSLGADFALVSVVDRAHSSDEKAWQIFERAFAQALPDGDIRRCKVHHLRTSEKTADKIIDVAKTFKADLIVMGAKGPSLAATHLHAGVVTQVLVNARCPVLTIRAD